MVKIDWAHRNIKSTQSCQRRKWQEYATLQYRNAYKILVGNPEEPTWEPWKWIWIEMDLEEMAFEYVACI
jgi:hypothetical protein